MLLAADFELFETRFQGDPEWNARRLEVRHRLQALGEEVKARYQVLGLGLERRESLHHPHHTNRQKVRRQRTMLFRDKKARRALQSFLGRELGKDLDSARNNVHLQCVLDEKSVWWGLRIDEGAWYDLNVLLKLAEEPEGRRRIVAACQAAPGFLLLVDGRGARPLEGMSERDWRDLAGILRPGESRLEVERRLSKQQAVTAGEELLHECLAGVERLAGFYRCCCWTLDGSTPFGASI